MKVRSRILFLMSFSLSAFADGTAFLAVKGKVIQTSQLGEFKEYLIQAPQSVAFSSTLKEESVNSLSEMGFLSLLI